MKDKNIRWFFRVFVVCLLVQFGVSGAPAWGGSMRITMTDGTSVDVPYYWEFQDEIKFDIAGGVAGVPKSQVASIQEILEAKDFDPEVIFMAPEDASKSDQRALLKDLVQSKVPGAKCDEKPPEENMKLLRETAAEAKRTSQKSKGQLVHGQRFNVERNFSTVCNEAGGPMLVVQNVVNSKVDLKDRDFTLTLFDAEGKVLLKKPCELQEIKVDKDTLKQLNMKGRLYLVKASVKPDPKIKRYEITSSKR
jgi:hypothetical protein